MPDGANIEHWLSPRHAEALALAARGIPVFPCQVGGKPPAVEKGFKAATTSPDQINAWWSQADYNIGVRPADMGVVALDLDLYKPDGVSKAIRDMLPDTFTIQSPRLGLHKLYLSIEEFSNSAFAQNVDVRSGNGYILWPPSVTADGEYRVIDAREPVMLPERIANNLRIKRDKPDACEIEDDGVDKMLEEARTWCERYAPNQSPDRFVAAAALVRNFGLTNKTATELCDEFGIRMQSDSPDGTSWERTLDNARRYGEGELGTGVAWQPPPVREDIPPLWNALAARDPSLVPPAEVVGWEPDPAPGMQYDDPLDVPTKPILAGSEKGQEILAKLIEKLRGVAEETIKPAETPPRPTIRFPRRRPSEAKDQPPMVWLDADNLFPSGPRIMVIYAEKTNLKTQFALAKSIEIVSRTEGRVLYIAAEDGHGVDTQRLPAYVEKRGIDWQTLDDHWWSISEPIDLIGDGEQLVADVKEQGFAPDVVVIDVPLTIDPQQVMG